MPELPDLEVLQEQLQSLRGDSIETVAVHFPVTCRLLIEGTPEQVLSNQNVHHIWRRGKFLVFTLDGLYMVFNLMLTGRLQVTSQPKKTRNTVVILTFASGNTLRFDDFKKMGKVYITDNLEKIPQYPELGIEPLSEEFTLERFSHLFNDAREVKVVLTDQRLIAGIGNAYSDEILFHAKINPGKKANSLTDKEISDLHGSVRFVLEHAVHEIKKSANQSKETRDFLYVHGKKGEKCPVCGSVIREIDVAGRVTHVCPRCQHVKFPW
jgi:formamidopyrimidine-DNA glycosylase